MRYYADRTYLFGTFDIVIKDEEGNKCYKLSNKGNVGYNYELLDVTGKKFADIKQVISLFKNQFAIRANADEIMMAFTHELKINGAAYCKFSGLDWSTEGDIHHHDYSLRDGSNVVARVRLTGSQVKANGFVNMTEAVKITQHELERCLEIECSDEYDKPLTLAVIFAIELAERNDGSRYSG